MLATPSEAHAEWHRNTGIPVGLPGCPQDACHTDHLDRSEVRALVRQRDINWALMRGEDGDATIACAHCHGVHLAVAYVRSCTGENRPEAPVAPVTYATALGYAGGCEGGHCDVYNRCHKHRAEDAANGVKNAMFKSYND